MNSDCSMAPLAGPPHFRQPVERALQDVNRGVLVDDLGAPARLMSIPINSRSTAAVESRSSHRPMGDR